MKDKLEILAYLNRNPLKHIVHLKVLATYEPHIQSHYVASGEAAGVLFLVPTPVTTYESVTYPETQYVALITSDTPAIGQKLAAHIPTGCNLIFKFMTPHDRAVIAAQLALTRAISFLSYTAPPNARFATAGEVVVSQEFDLSLMPLFHENGYTSAEIAAHFADDQALSFAIFAQEQPVSVCLAYQNYGRIWEIGMVYTVPQARRQGHARKIVETALHLLLANGRMPRYQMADTNQASQALAAYLGLTRFLITEHYLYVPAHTSSKNIYASTT